VILQCVRKKRDKIIFGNIFYKTREILVCGSPNKFAAKSRKHFFISPE